MSVWPVSGCVFTANDGSSMPSRSSACRSLSCCESLFRLDGDRHRRRREAHQLERDGRARVTQRVARGGAAQAERGGDVAAGDVPDLLALVGVHAHEATDPLAAALAGVVDRGAGLHLPGIHAEVRELAVQLVVHHLEGERAERLVVGGGAAGGLALRSVAGDGRHVGWRRQVVHQRRRAAAARPCS
jgi:hypothetical protein